MSNSSLLGSEHYLPLTGDLPSFGDIDALLRFSLLQENFHPQIFPIDFQQDDLPSPASTYNGIDEESINGSWAPSCLNYQPAPEYLPLFDPVAQTDNASSDGTCSRSVSVAPSVSTRSDRGTRRREAMPWAWGDSLDSDSGMYDCPQCSESFNRVFELEEHAKKSNHKPFLCHQCEQTFSRRDAWTRHRQLHQSRGRYPCTKCDKYNGMNAFKRRDHLKKHLLAVHNQDTDFPRLCPESSCAFSSAHDAFKQFDRRKDYTRHMRENHGRETYDCKMGDCRRVGSRGFARKHDLVRHLEKEHRATDGENVVDLKSQWR